MGVYFEQEFLVDSRDVDLFNHCRPSALLGYLQEAATGAAVELHVSRYDTMARYHAFWMLARMWYRLDTPLRWNDRLTVRTWHRGGRGAAMYRDYDIYQAGRLVGEGVSTWVLADADTHKLLRLGDVAEFQNTDGGELCKDKTLSRLRRPQELEVAGRREMRYSDTDINGHVNNVRYADFVCDALHLERRQGEFVTEMQIGFLSECRAGETVDMLARWDGAEGFVSGVGQEGTARFDCALTLGTV